MLITKLFKFVVSMSAKYGIDESHGLSHSMQILHYANEIYKQEVLIKPYLVHQQRIIYTSAILHDMCDKKYMNEHEGIAQIEYFLKDKLMPVEVATASKIMTTMSYSTIKKYGTPDLGIFQTSFNIVREADLLSAYDFERSMIYHMRTKNANLEEAYEDAECIFNQRILRYYSDGLFLTQYGKTEAPLLHIQAVEKMTHWRHIIYDSSLSHQYDDDIIV
jgi:HD superfamily phosphodiesterase